MCAFVGRHSLHDAAFRLQSALPGACLSMHPQTLIELGLYPFNLWAHLFHDAITSQLSVSCFFPRMEKCKLKKKKSDERERERGKAEHSICVVKRMRGDQGSVATGESRKHRVGGGAEEVSLSERSITSPREGCTERESCSHGGSREVEAGW